MKAEIREHNGALRLFVNGEIMAPDAYFTYFMEHSRYNDFAEAGYKLYSLPMFFSSKTFPVLEKTDDMVRIISKPASKVSTKVVSASVKEAEINSAKRFESYMVR